MTVTVLIGWTLLVPIVALTASVDDDKLIDLYMNGYRILICIWIYIYIYIYLCLFLLLAANECSKGLVRASCDAAASWPQHRRLLGWVTNWLRAVTFP